MKPQSYPKNHRQGRKAGSRIGDLTQEGAHCLSSAKWLALKTYIQVALYGLNRLYLEIYVVKYARMHTMTFSGKRGYHSEGEWGGRHGRVWR